MAGEIRDKVNKTACSLQNLRASRPVYNSFPSSVRWKVFAMLRTFVSPQRPPVISLLGRAQQVPPSPDVC